MGASRGRIVRQLLTESVLISLAGGILGLLLADAALGPLLKISAGSVPQVFTVELDRWVLVFTLAASVVTGLIFGLVPALRTAKLDLRETLNEASRGSTSGPGQHRLRGALVGMEIALAMLLLVGAGLLLRSFERLQDVSAGFSPDHLLLADLPLSQNAYAKPEQRFQFFDRIVERASTLPGVRSAAAASFLPVSGGGGLIHFNITGRPPTDALLPVFQMSMVLRTAADPSLETSALRSALAEIDPNQPLVNVRSMEQNMSTSVAQPRFRTWLIGIFAAVALVLAAVGVYGVMSYTVTQRTSEIGIRVTLGAQSTDVFRSIVGEGLRIAIFGVGAGILAALALTRLLRSFLYGISASDPATFVLVAFLLILVTAAACYFPARRATRVDPIVALRYE
jgi:predicted lysophospholipase L1 biosynthesis ABC-type transport system permease subunit